MKRMILPWRDIGIHRALLQIGRFLENEMEAVPSENTRTIQKFERWLDQIGSILFRIERAKTELIPHLKSRLGVEIHREEMLIVSLFQPSTKNLFLELESHFCRGIEPGASVDCDMLRRLASTSEMAKVLALVGDAAISLAVLHRLWTPEMLDVGDLTQARARSVSNEHLAALCDEWRLYEYRIHFDPPAESKSEMEHDKGTLVEAIYGIVYLMHGLDAVIGIIDPLVER